MDNTEFLALVKQMRETQKMYFKTRRKTFLFKSKELEKQVDLKLEKLGVN